jgi:archaellum biogenesis protein FlaJ (TadC family)
MREYNAAELDLMAKAYERAYERNSASLENLKNANPLLVSSVVESLVSGIVEAIDQGERNEEFLVSAALSKINSLLAGPTS